MSRDVHVLLTNDDGIDAPGLRAMYESLSSVATVTTVAPATNRSGAGRSLTYGRIDADGRDVDAIDLRTEKFSCTVPHRSHELGYAVEGTPCDCVVVGVNALDPTPDVVVSGCNPGINLGTHVFTRSGTVSAAYEAACLGVPALAVSLDKVGFDRQFEPGHFEPVTDLAARLVDYAVRENSFDAVDYLNLNAPRPDRPLGDLVLTEPTDSYELHATVEDDRFRLTNGFWEQFAADQPTDPPGTDRRTVADGDVSLSPLGLPFEPVFPPELEQFAAAVDPGSA